MLHIAISGQFDAFVPDFIRGFLKNRRDGVRWTALHFSPLDMNVPVTWRTGSLLAERNTLTMLEDVDVLLYFAMTPPDDRNIPEGAMHDVALCAATCLARAAQKSQNLRVILVSREIHHKMTLGNDEAYWRQIENLFRQNVQELKIIHTQPVLSEFDAITLAVYEYARCFPRETLPDEADRRVAPVEKTRFYDAIAHAIDGGGDIDLEGTNALTWREWLDLNAEAVPKRRFFQNLQRARYQHDDDVKRRHRLLKAFMRETPELQGPFPHQIEGVRRFLASAYDEDLTPPKLFLTRKSAPKAHLTSCVQRILDRSSRSISDIADLLMEWLPRYLKRTISLESTGNHRVLCRALRIPLVELEKVDESERVCRILVRCPWFSSVNTPVYLAVMDVGAPDSPGPILVVVENSLHLDIVSTGLRAMLASFGKYLREYS